MGASTRGRFFFLKSHATGAGNGTGDKYNVRTREVVRQACEADEDVWLQVGL